MTICIRRWVMTLTTSCQLRPASWSLRKVETFFCPSPLLTDASMEVFGSWGGSLLQLRLNSDRITDAGMAHMARCTRLTNMFIPKGVTWRGVAHLDGKPLVTIVVWGNRNIDDRALEELVPLWEQTPTRDWNFCSA